MAGGVGFRGGKGGGGSWGGGSFVRFFLGGGGFVSSSFSWFYHTKRLSVCINNFPLRRGLYPIRFDNPNSFETSLGQ